MHIRLSLICLMLLMAGGCTHASSDVCAQRVVLRATAGRSDCNTAAARIHLLMAQGKFVEAKALIAEASAGGLISQPHAARLLSDIARLSTKLGDVHARLQRVKDFPSQLKDYTLYEIDQMLKQKDFSIATMDQLKLAKKLILESPRLMEKSL
ncbi:MAG TPA: hypothetical protein VEU33_11350 [Archangium sp.]|nr:hypothetical protein [Archangium sp.]